MQNNEPNNDQLIEQLRNVAEAIADQSLKILREAHLAGESKRPEAERTLTQARRAIEKAINLLTSS